MVYILRSSPSALLETEKHEACFGDIEDSFYINKGRISCSGEADAGGTCELFAQKQENKFA